MLFPLPLAGGVDQSHVPLIEGVGWRNLSNRALPLAQKSCATPLQQQNGYYGSNCAAENWVASSAARCRSAPISRTSCAVN
ncbi:hypothetical protein BV95_02612 [Sphingobium chlorophenolicum]|uniref:Uncharacterized protein n=1 Tax=Sphingobium chlorophenolicum TaxID=46429 RepID=A0A081RD15_SPHCR|nr:hypothetical protein BV95_02612 [Sphingobium chlorophenolicum]